MIVATTGAVPGFVATNEGILPLPFAANPIVGWLFVQVYVVTPPVLTVAKATVVVLSPLQTTSLTGCSTSAVGLTVTVRLKEVPLHPFTLGVIIYTTSIGVCSGIDECLGDGGRTARSYRVTDTCYNAPAPGKRSCAARAGGGIRIGDIIAPVGCCSTVDHRGRVDCDGQIKRRTCTAVNRWRDNIMYYYRFGSGIDEGLGDSGRTARSYRVTDTCNNCPRPRKRSRAARARGRIGIGDIVAPVGCRSTVDN